MKEFEAVICIRGDDDATSVALMAAMQSILIRAKCFIPDGRFDWQGAEVYIDAEPNSTQVTWQG